MKRMRARLCAVRSVFRRRPEWNGARRKIARDYEFATRASCHCARATRKGVADFSSDAKLTKAGALHHRARVAHYSARCKSVM
jgi:hypothetical protein